MLLVAHVSTRPSNSWVQMAKLSVVHANQFFSGQLIVVRESAGKRLSGKRGTVLGRCATRSKVRVLLDGSKGPITLHASFLRPADRAIADEIDLIEVE